MQPDSIIPDPGNPQDWNRYSYVRDNPLKYTDPTGHWACGDYYDTGCVETFAEAGAMMRSTGMNALAGGKTALPIVARKDWGQYAPGDNPGNFPDESRETYDPNDEFGGYYEYPGNLADALDTVVIHHVGGENNQGNDPRTIETTHMVDERLYDVPYHYIVGFDGIVYEGRNIGARGAHVLGGNTGKVGVVLLGNFNIISPTQDQLDAAVGLLLFLEASYDIDTVGGHSMFNPTDCPGTNFPGGVILQWGGYLK